MEAEGLVVRRVDPVDNRFTLVALTEKGRATVDAIRPMARAFGAKLQEGCDPEELAIASRLLEVIRQRALTLAAESPCNPASVGEPPNHVGGARP
jgi:DNA-binding MarR family transcriptional regulator